MEDNKTEPTEKASSGEDSMQRLVMLQKSITTLKDLTTIQCKNGNWNYDPYMHGMANGMIFALSLFEGGEPKYLDAPDKWLKDVVIDGEPVISEAT